MSLHGLFAVLLGSAVGSFINLAADRLPEGQSIMEPPSHCPQCQRPLHPLELIPVLSFILLGRRCRSCGSPIPWRVLLVEILSGVAFFLVWLKFGYTLHSLFGFTFLSMLLLLSVIDLEEHKLPNSLLYPGILLSLLLVPVNPVAGWEKLLLGGILGFGLMLAIALISPGGMGMGDVKLAAFIGLILGLSQTAIALLVSFMTGGLVAGVLLIMRRIERKDPIAFGPFLACGASIAYLYGDSLWGWWVGRL